MTPTTRVPIRAGNLAGAVFWDPLLHTFAVTLDVFVDKPEQRYPPQYVRHGTRRAEFVTTDALLNHLRALGLPPDEESLVAVDRYGRVIAGAIGETEFVGITIGERPGGAIARMLFLRTPVGDLLELNPRIAHVDHRFDWGSVVPGTIDTARLICEIAFLRRPGPDMEAFALALTYEFLAEAGSDFSVSATAVCDWYLTDAAPWTTLDDHDRRSIRARFGSRPEGDRSAALERTNLD